MEVKAGMICLHFKGNCYLVEDVVENSENQKKMVLYKALYGEQKRYVRPYDMFVSKVDKQKYPDAQQEYRFQPIFELKVYKEQQTKEDDEILKTVQELTKRVEKLETQVVGLKNEQKVLKKDVKRIDHSKQAKKDAESLLNM